MAKSTLDFFPTEKETSLKPSVFRRRRSFRDIQEVTSKINPEILKSVIANASARNTPTVCDPTLRLSCGFVNNNAENIPMTIFYNGKVSVYNMSQHKAQEILKLAKESVAKESNLVETSDGDLPQKRKRSLLRFLEKRNERLASASPY